ncbi:MAG: 3'-5' exoribonuclease YhaM family protein [Suipraeoptans sp.]
MKYINTFKEGENIRSIYMCKGKRVAETRNGKVYDNLILQDKTGTVDAKIWDPNSNGIADYEENDFIEIYAEVTSYNNNLQVNIKQLRVAHEDEYEISEYLPSTEKNKDMMYEELLGFVRDVDNKYYRQALEFYFVNDEQFIKTFKEHSAAKTVHHGFAGGLLEHTLSVVKFCQYMLGAYPILKKDLLYTAALFHDIGKTKELSPMPQNDYTDEGQLLGHIVIGISMIDEAIRNIERFPVVAANELKHCVIAHHGELEYGSPKKPALVEALALNFADCTDAKMQTFMEIFKNKEGTDWTTYNRLFESNLRQTSDE